MEPGRWGLRILKRGKAWWYQALSVGVVFFGREILTSIANKRTMRKTMAIMILSNHIAMRSFRNSHSRRKGVSCAWLSLRLSISLSDIFLARLSLWLFCLPKSPSAHDPRDDESSGCNDPRIVSILLSRRPFQRLCLPVSSIAIATLSKACATAETQGQIYRGLLPAVANLSDLPQSPLCETKVSCHPGDQR
jgi:hypothetical protein